MDVFNQRIKEKQEYIEMLRAKKFLNGTQNNFAYVENEKNPKILPTLT